MALELKLVEKSKLYQWRRGVWLGTTEKNSATKGVFGAYCGRVKYSSNWIAVWTLMTRHAKCLFTCS
jgi:hypothetical protein